MKAMSRVGALLVLSVLVFALVALPALAQEETATTVATEQVSRGDMEPAVEITQPVEKEEQLDWTYRYMIPTGIALGAIVIVLTAAQYFNSVVRKRYRIVEE